MAKRIRSNNPGDAANAFVRVLLSDAGELAGGLDAKQWDKTLKFFDYRCAYTGESVAKDKESSRRDGVPLAVQEHAIPINRDHCGLHLYGNVVPATVKANGKKGDKHYRDFIKDPEAEKLGFDSARLQKIEGFMVETRYCEKAKPFRGLPEYCQTQYEVIKALCKINKDYLRKLLPEDVAKQVNDDVTKSMDVQVQTRLGRGKITREAVLAVIRGEVGTGMRRGAIIEALGIKGNWSGEVAVDNRLRELKKQGSVLHEGGRYRCP